jgi:hypothetical protein
MTTEADALILRYLQDLESQLGDLPGNRRQELLDEVSAHIAAARADLAPETEAGVRTMLERLGDPADIAAEARDRAGVEAGPARPATPWLEIATVVLLVLPFLGWVLVSAGGPVGQPGVDVGTTGPNPLELILVVAPFVLPVAAAVHLGVRLRARMAAVPATRLPS